MRFYFEHVTDYQRAYGHLNKVVMLLLWLYFSEWRRSDRRRDEFRDREGRRAVLKQWGLKVGWEGGLGEEGRI